MALEGALSLPNGDGGTIEFVGTYWRLRPDYVVDAGGVKFTLDAYADTAARQAGEPPTGAGRTLLLPLTEFGWQPGDPVPELTAADIYLAAKARPEFAEMADL